jgi:hypothetical protein
MNADATHAQTDALPPPPPQDAATALVAAAEVLWPAPASVDIARTGTQVAAGRRIVREHVLIPNAQHPRLIVPARSRLAAGAIAAHRQGSGGMADRVTARAAALLVRAGVADRLFRDRLRISAPTAAETDDVEIRLSELLGQAVTVGLYVGTARVNRKPVLHAVNDDGRTLAFVKVGHTEAARNLVRNEAATLAALAERSLSTVVLPQVLAHVEWNNYDLLVLSPLHGRALPPRPNNAPYTAMRELAAVHGLAQTRIGESGLVKRLAGVPNALNTKAADRYAAALARLEAGDASVTVGAWHGDWQPFNMARVDRERIALWDWERFATDVPVGFDALHYLLQSLIHGRGVGPHIEREFLARAEAAAVRGGVLDDTAAIVVAAYVGEIAARYLTLAEGPDGELLARRAMWSLGLLESCVARL